ncbi:MAG: YggS family pyridoxal phosphate-dependent enzyme [Gammaproteobacteria bacterium]|nr:YggS family pyridoxal phosphate-dependent enzyme [Gammaproteobacteria bacterium]MCP4091593.1 YggS family pyridoxal phosphate-dependent enzyme [Gammaproteobacteria bacterium]MCP4276089.1 YggS family pyridoxal phosphate-dependent enzyme [Gammaproteobacteria bacterium]MCP4832581.1 YggS family pyridoxal phosphate-dependent enzyme [Gammaproteobacteria bacterium]MCP4929659.1 YggS family pyridoxal phosphate-dependent enzyme [Gammaproteobacteria bacterium]
MTHITKHLEDLQQRIYSAARATGRSENEVSILAVSKHHSVTAIKSAIRAGLADMGENYLQEALTKIPQFGHEITWHFIGRIQSNKTSEIAQNFHWAHTIDNERIARRLSEQRPTHLGPLNVCIQICTDSHKSHGGIPPEAAATLCAFVETQPALKLRGLMTIPLPENSPELQRAPFKILRELRDDLATQGHELDTLSMGMSADLEAAIAEGSTMIRIGTALFGPRPG